MSRARLLRPEGTWWGQRCSSGSRTRTWVPEVSFGRLRLRDSWGSRLELQQLKWCAWVAVYCSFISFANSRSSEDTKQMMSSFMLSISAVVMSYLQNPQPMTPPW
uniref:PAT complex subunit Asterix n=1 Tax=Bos taurus TaxID=9913 RepID=A0ABI0NT17_BOVIN